MATNVRLFGCPEIDCDGVAKTPDTRKAVAVLAYLAVEGPSARRDRLAWMLWPESSQERARAALRRTLTSLRSVIGAEGLSSTRETITLEHGRVSIDTVSFRDAIDAGHLYVPKSSIEVGSSRAFPSGTPPISTTGIDSKPTPTAPRQMPCSPRLPPT